MKVSGVRVIRVPRALSDTDVNIVSELLASSFVRESPTAFALTRKLWPTMVGGHAAQVSGRMTMSPIPWHISVCFLLKRSHSIRWLGRVSRICLVLLCQ